MNKPVVFSDSIDVSDCEFLYDGELCYAYKEIDSETRYDSDLCDYSYCCKHLECYYRKLTRALYACQELMFSRH